MELGGLKRARGPLAWIAVAVASAMPGCGGDDKAVVDEETTHPSGPAALLVGTWSTSAVHDEHGEVEARLTLRADGSLTMVAELPGGGRLTFPGTWEVEGAELVLRGAYFQPEGVARARYAVTVDGTLLLEDESGQTEEWSPG